MADESKIDVTKNKLKPSKSVVTKTGFRGWTELTEFDRKRQVRHLV